MTTSQSFIRELMSNHELSQAELARKLGTTRVIINRIYKGHNEMSLELRREIVLELDYGARLLLFIDYVGSETQPRERKDANHAESTATVQG